MGGCNLPSAFRIAAAAACIALPGTARSQGTVVPVTIRTEQYAIGRTHTGEKPMLVDLYRIPGAPLKGAVILIHGGAFSTAHREIAENRQYGEALARRGYLAAAISYRLHGDGPVVDGWANAYADIVRNSSDPRLTELIQRLGPTYPDAVAAAAVDLVAAVRWLREHANRLDLDPQHIALFGASAGGITALTGAYNMGAFGDMNLDVAAVIDLRALMLRDRSRGNPFEAQGPPLMILHGEDDQRVPLSDAEAVFDLAKQGGTAVEFYTVPGFGHELGGTTLLELRLSSRESVLDRMDGFLTGAFARTVPKRSIRGRLLRTDSTQARQSGESSSVGSADSLFRSSLADAVGALIAAVRPDTGFIPSLYGMSKPEALLHPFDDAGRRDWSYWPRTRTGLSIGRMTSAQRQQLHVVLATFLSSRGYLQVNHIMLLEDILASTETQGFDRGADEYAIAVFGEPRPAGSWGIRFEGHHVSLNVTITPEGVSVTPSFLGASPVPVPAGSRAGFNPLQSEQRMAHALLMSLDSSQRAAAILDTVPPAEVLSSQFRAEPNQWDRWRQRLSRDGVLASAFTAEQRRLLRRLLVEIVGTYRPEIGMAWLDTLDVNTLAFAWMGASELERPHYYRVQGEDFVFEFDAAQENGTHVHTVWRDRQRDFGTDALRRHYLQKHQRVHSP